MLLKQVYDPYLSQYAYLVGCPKSGEALIIDAERDIDRYLSLAEENDLEITAVAETHIHADFLAGTRQLLENHSGVHAYLSKEGGEDWQYEWAQNNDAVTLLGDGDRFSIGNVQITALHLPGHTPEHLCFLVEDHGGGADQPMAIVSGDFMFVGDVGRPDLLESAAGESGSQEKGAQQLFESIQKFAELPEFLAVLPGHGAGSSCGKSLGSIPFSTTGYELRFNDAVRTALDKGEEAFVEKILEGQPEPPMYFSRMKTTNRDGVAVLPVLPTPEKMSASDVAQACKDNSGKLVFVDTRSDREAFMDSHLKDSIYAPYGPKFSEAVGSYVEAGKKICLLVESEDQVESCVRQLVRIGMDEVTGYAMAADVVADESCQSCLKSTKTISTTEMNPDNLILDVRGADEFAEAHVPGAVNVAHTRLIADQDSLPDVGAVTVHCGSGLRASLATAALERLGFDVTYANGKFSDWKDQAEKVAQGE